MMMTLRTKSKVKAKILFIGYWWLTNGVHPVY
jgi:hypothetical protein